MVVLGDLYVDTTYANFWKISFDETNGLQWFINGFDLTGVMNSYFGTFSLTLSDSSSYDIEIGAATNTPLKIIGFTLWSADIDSVSD